MNKYTHLILICIVALLYACNGPAKKGAQSDTTEENYAKKFLPPVYQERESVAPPELKSRLQEERRHLDSAIQHFLIGNTAVSEMPLSSILGEGDIPPEEVAKIKDMMRNKVEEAAITTLLKQTELKECVASLRHYDGRPDSLMPGIRFQQCSDCWAYSAIGCLECSHIRVNRISHPANIDLSEGQMVDCSGGGTCSGGLTYKVFEYLKTNHTKLMADSQDPDDGNQGECPKGKAQTNIEVWDWGVVDTSGDINRIASVNNIKEAICKYGAVSCSLDATRLFQDYAGGGVFYENESNYDNPSSNHAVIIVGWDDDKQAWLVKNTWSVRWGDNGYGWVKYNTNNIGRRAAWVLVKPLPPSEAINPQDSKTMQRYKTP